MLKNLVAGACIGVAACAPGGLDRADTEADAASPALSIAALESMEGAWTGTLTYLDYQDNETRVSLPTEVEFTPTNDGLSYTFVYTEPSGATVADEGELRLESGGGVSMGDTEFQVQDFELDGQGHLGRLVLSQRGTDGDRPSLLVRTIRVERDRMSMIQEVLPDGDTVRFTRNEYDFIRR